MFTRLLELDAFTAVKHNKKISIRNKTFHVQKFKAELLANQKLFLVSSNNDLQSPLPCGMLPPNKLKEKPFLQFILPIKLPFSYVTSSTTW